MPHASEKPGKKPGIAASRKVKDYGNQPFFVKKVEASKKVIKKYGLPPDLTGSKSNSQ